MGLSITVRKGNTELDVPKDQKDRYLKLGYSVYEGGKLVEEALTDDVGVLLSKISAQQNTIAELEKEVTKLKTSLTKKDKELAALKKVNS
nr:MAG TPA: Monopolin complex subunit CSM1, Monopolin, rDNA, REPLICATION.9A [Caudoviricetes sp.]